MKKFVSGVIVGALLFGGASAFAGSASLIGQKVQGLFTVEKNGAKVADAIIINGSAYAPIRAVSEATGTKLTIEGKKIIMGDATANQVSDTTNNVSNSLVELQSQRESLIANIEKKKTHIKNYGENQLHIWESLIKENPNSTTVPQWKEALERDKVVLEELKAELATLEAQLIEIDAKIAAFNE
ncbi:MULTISPECIES: hypothetical protein [unclassified Paenibacillus]|uniref:hypothetical protein n=1 Tax=unclassified Paenibacillus TaxID=185978 RepID=UPI0030FA8241